MQAKLKVNFDRLSGIDFLVKSGSIVAALTGNPNFVPPWILQVPSLLDITTAFNEYEAAYHDALSKDIFKVALRESTRLILTSFLKQLAPYLELVAFGDVSKLISSGYDLRNDATHKQGSEPLPAPKDFKVVRGTFSGTLNVNVTKLKGAVSYEVQITQGDPEVETDWHHALSASSCQRIPLAGLNPMQVYWLRIRGLGCNGMGVWSNALSIIVL
ncbi:MAG: hypothetical protein NTY69_05315 [Methylococcales bacterium]|nr:hypothetical protein [Methylococcales bacterium]